MTSFDLIALLVAFVLGASVIALGIRAMIKRQDTYDN
jgi:hypothetical protein